MKVRIARPEDGEAVAQVYRPFVASTAITFELDPPSAAETSRRIAATLPTYPWLVCEASGVVVGYAYATRHRARPAYRWSVETSVYLAAEVQGRGAGRRVYQALVRVLQLQGYQQAFAGIALPNPASVGLHEALGYRSIGIYREVGHKFGAWHDVGWWQLSLHAGTARPAPIVGVDELDEAGLADALE